MRRITRPIWFLVALAFLAEAWLWKTLSPIIGSVLAWLPIEPVRQWARRRIETMPPAAALLVFLVPVLLLLPLKFVGLWLLMNHHWLAALCLLAFAKASGVGMTAFVFDATRPKLLQLPWFRALHDTVLRCYAWAHRMADPYLVEIRRQIARLRVSGHGRIARIRRIRQRMLIPHRTPICPQRARHVQSSRAGD